MAKRKIESSVNNLARGCHIVSVFWVLVLAIIIFIDVSGRFLFNAPLLGAPEIIKNSVVSITFLQLPLAIYLGGMIRTTLAYDRVSPTGQRYLRSLANILGFLFFLFTAFSSWGPAVEAWQIGEYEGEGALRVPTYPVRFLVAATAAFTAIVYFHLLYLDWTNQPKPENSKVARA
ncbi:MAG: TRAP transporter small permease [Gammaproteobacteria bacterium]|jgi:TRAP-type C4-dicarboxylate transport system permease small subunit